MAHHGSHRQVACAVLTASDTRTPETDTSGQRIQTLLREAGHQVPAYTILPDDPQQIGQQLDTWLTKHRRQLARQLDALDAFLDGAATSTRRRK